MQGRIKLLFLLLLAVLIGRAQTISQYEYWLDADYGHRQVVATNSTAVDQSIDISGLSDGIHYLNFRAVDGDGVSGLYYRYLFMVPASEMTDATVSGYEYWIDADYANRVSSSEPSTNVAQSIDVSRLSSGVHYLNFRAVDGDGVSGLYYRYLFMVPASEMTDATVSGYEYWIDADYANRVSSSEPSTNVAQSIDVSTLSSGIHYLNFRAKRTDGEPGLYYRYLFVVPEKKEDYLQIDQVKYWVDDDSQNSQTLKVNEEQELIISMDISQLKADTTHVFNITAISKAGLETILGSYEFSFASELEPEPYAVLTTDSTTILSQDSTGVTYGKTLTFYYDIEKEARSGMSVGPLPDDDNGGAERGWHEKRADITSVVFDESFAMCDTISSTAHWLAGCESLKSITGIENLNTSNVTSMHGMFYKCSSLTSLDVTHFDTQNVKNLKSMFQLCSQLKTIDLSNFNTDNVTNMNFMFAHAAGLNTIYVGDKWSTKSVASSTDMFYNCTSLVGGKGTVYDASHTDYTYAHIDGGVDNPGYFTRSGDAPYTEPEHYAVLTGDSLLTFYYDGNKTARTGMSIGPFDYPEMRPWQNNIADIKRVVFDASIANDTTIISTAFWFYECSNITEIEGLQYLNTENVTNMAGTFSRCSSLLSLDVGHFNTAKVTKMSDLFSYCAKVPQLDVSRFVTDNVTGMDNMFGGCESLEAIDVSGFKTDNVTNMLGMFEDCKLLKVIDVSGFNTAKCTYMRQMFSHCNSVEILDVSHFNTSNCTSFGNMFLDCSSLTSLDVSSFNTAKASDLSSMFSGCSGLTSLDVSNFDMSEAKDIRTMFSGCSNLTELDLSNFHTPKVERINFMFMDCTSLVTIDLSNMTTANVLHMNNMFYNCPNLTTIYAGNWDMSSMEASSQMFTGCTKLVGGKGTVYDSGHIDHTYAHIDGGTSNPGYFTDKNAPVIDATFDSNGVLAVGGSTTMTDALESVGGRDKVAKTITAIVWNSSAALTNSDLTDISNPNMLIYVPSESQAPQNRDNVVIGNDSTGYTAKNVVLTDVVEGNGNFYCPKEFTAEMISYTHEYRQTTEVGVSRGWETIAMPFNVQTVMHEKQGLIAPFGNSTSKKHFWLRHISTAGQTHSLAQATTIEANMPYLISMPNSDAYPDEYNLAGRVTFSSQNVPVMVTDIFPVHMSSGNGGMLMFVPCFQTQQVHEMVYALNVGEARDGYPEGSVFEANYREIRPFEAYTVHEGNSPAPQFIPVSDFVNSNLTGIEELRFEDVNVDQWYDLNGRKLQKKPTQKGVYLLNGRKVVMR